MAIQLKNEKVIPSIALSKVHVLSWLQTEKKEKPYTIAIQAEVILYGHDEDGNRVYDPAGSKRINVQDFRAMLGEHLQTLDEKHAAELLAVQGSYIKALAYMITLTAEFGEVG